jgi:hypothetical protein
VIEWKVVIRITKCLRRYLSPLRTLHQPRAYASPRLTSRDNIHEAAGTQLSLTFPLWDRLCIHVARRGITPQVQGLCIGRGRHSPASQISILPPRKTKFSMTLGNHAQLILEVLAKRIGPSLHIFVATSSPRST